MKYEINAISPKCQYCGKIMVETGFERDDMSIPISLWSCRSGPCPNYANPQRSTTSTIKEEKAK